MHGHAPNKTKNNREPSRHLVGLAFCQVLLSYVIASGGHGRLVDDTKFVYKLY